MNQKISCFTDWIHQRIQYDNLSLANLAYPGNTVSLMIDPAEDMYGDFSESTEDLNLGLLHYGKAKRYQVFFTLKHQNVAG